VTRWTPADIHNVTFNKPPIPKRGYNEDEVDAFLDALEAELARLIEKNHDLRNQVERLDQQLRAAPVNTGPPLRPFEPPPPVMAPVQPPRREQTPPDGDHHVQAAMVLSLAQELADRLTGEAKAEADGTLSKARTKFEQLLSDAKAKVDGVVNEARTRAETMLHDARTRAETLDRQSREKAASLERDAARKHTEIIGSLSQEKSTLEKKINELRALDHEYSTRLTTYLDSQLGGLDGCGSNGAHRK
jgi:DivIVA domain-containing protein